MTENEEVLKYIKQKIEENPSMEDLELYKLSFYPSEMMILVEAIEEIQAYRAIGTVEDINEVMKSGAYYMEIAHRFQSIGTIEEFKALKESKCQYWNAEHKDCALDYSEIRNKAIDEFAERITNKDNIVRYDIDEIMSNGNFDYNCDCLRRYIDEIAEQLKGGDI